ncbi:MAG: PLP-dependent aminotransferase family protein [Acidobacteria bacterium]|nr:PLP-dependent aminotransferase family protein [Acidobacteriota bacterium]
MRAAITLDPASATPLQRQIYDEWRRGILTGRFRGGDRVPSTRDLARTLGVSRATATAAYEQLIAEGYLEAARGSGTFVSRELPDDLLRAGRGRARPAAAPPVSAEPRDSGGWVRFSSQWRPDLKEFPFALWRRLLNRHLRGRRADLFDYCAIDGGYPPLREEIAAYVARSRAVECGAGQVIVVNGSQQALDLCARLLMQAGDPVAMENPGYQGARRIFEARGVRLLPVRIDASGIAVSEIPAGARAVYVTPSHQFPTGVSMTVARRLELIEWARRNEAWIVEDDYDSEYRYSGPPLPAMQGLAAGAPVIYVGTFSKVMFPGLRIGYLIAPRKLVPAFVRAKWLVDRQTPYLEQAALADFLREGHLERHIRRTRRIYGRRRAVLTESLTRHFGDGARCVGDAAGMHVLVRFLDPEVAARAAARRVELASSALYYMGKAPEDEFVFGFAAVGERSIREGVRRLAR